MSATSASHFQDKLRITEIFFSLQGEANSVGWPTIFIRLTGCPLRCNYCDTAYAFSAGEWMTLEAIHKELAGYPCKRVTVTGGEPLAQPGAIPLLEQLCDAGMEVSLETSGALDVAAVDKRVTKVLDLKTPSSGELERNLLSNLEALNPQDQIKFVIADRADFDWAVALYHERKLATLADILFSPSHGVLAPGVLADWLLEEGIEARLQIQLHKYLWGDVKGR